MGVFSFLSIFFTHSTFNEKKFILTVSIMYGMIAPAMVGFSIWFKPGHILCKTFQTDEYHECLEKDVCANVSNYIIKIAEDSPPSLSATLGYICEMKKVLLEAYFFGGILGCLANLFLPIPANKRKLALVFFGLVHAAANFSIVLLHDNTQLLPLCFVTLAFSLMILHANCPLIINEAFVGDLAKASISVCLMCWGIMGLIYVLWSYINQADFYRCFIFMGMLHFINSLHLYMQDEPEVHEHLTAKKQSVLELTWQVRNEKNIPFNIFAYVLAWSGFCVTYNQVNLMVGMIGGSVFFNLGFFSLIEFTATFIGSYLGGKFPKTLGSVIRYLMIAEVVLSALFLLTPFELGPDFPKWGTVILFVMMALLKLGSDVINNAISLFAPKIFSIQYVRLFLAFSRLSSRLILICVPSIIVSLKKYGIHPFLFMSVFWLVCALLSTHVHPLAEDIVHTQAIQKRRTSSKDLRVKVEEHDDLYGKKIN